MKYTNPIISGFHPDPSVCRVGNDFFLVNSTFEYFPGIPVYHSTDLIHWEQIGHCLTRNSQVSLVKGVPNCLGIYAPTIRYSNGIFYVIVTNVANNDKGGNFIVWTKDIYGEWSEPIMTEFNGIDPSLFFDDDGKVYYSGTDYNIYVSELDINTGKAIGERHYVWNGSGANNPEGPHLYKVNGFYYLMIAEGGTELGHMVTIARSSSIFGPYESCPNNPILTNRGTGLPIKAVGHADIVEDANGHWWAVCLANRPISYPFRHSLGRETMLVPVKWENGWPVMSDGHVYEEMECEFAAGETTPNSGRYIPGSDMTDDFKGKTLHPSWNYIYNPVDNLVELNGNGLVLHANKYGISDDEPKALLCRRQEHFCFTALAKLTFKPADDNTEAGISIYMNERHHYEAALTMLDGKRCIILRRQIGTLKAVEKVIPYENDSVTLSLKATKEFFTFSYSENDTDFIEIGGGEASYLTTEVGGCFTGNYIAVYAGGNGSDAECDALFTEFTYRADK